jgi:hypothetical protein
VQLRNQQFQRLNPVINANYCAAASRKAGRRQARVKPDFFRVKKKIAAKAIPPLPKAGNSLSLYLQRFRSGGE